MDQEFLHELRQPLTAIQNYTRACINELSRQPEGREKVCAWLNFANQQAIRVSQMLNGQQAQELNAGRPLVPADIRPCIDHALGGLREQYGTDVAVLNVRSGEQPCHVLGDPALLEPVFRDLVVVVIGSLPRADDSDRVVYIEVYREKKDLVLDIGADAPAPGLTGKYSNTDANESVCFDLSTALCACEAVIKRYGGLLTLCRKPEGTVCVSLRLPIHE